MKLGEFLENLLAAEQLSQLKPEPELDVFEYPRWRITLWITSAFGAVLFVSWAVLFRSAEPVGRTSFVVIAMMIVSTFWGVRGLRRVRIVGTRLIAEFGFGKASRSWEIRQLVVDESTRRWNGEITVRVRESGRVAFTFLPDLAGWKQLVARLSKDAA